MAVEKVIAQIVAEVDDKSMKKAGDDMKLYARDTKKELDKSFLFKLTIDKAQTKIELDNAKAMLKRAKASNDEALILKYTIKTDELKSKLTQATRELNNFKNTGDVGLSRLQAKFDGVSKGANLMTNSIKTAGIAIAGAFSIDKLKGVSDTFIGMQNSLRQVAEGDALNTLQTKLLNTANNARVPVDDLTKSFVRFDVVNKQLGGTQDETLKIMDSLSKGLSMTGATARETGSVMLQLSQAFGSGRLQGDEFRAISESMPMLLDILSKKLGVARGDLKDYASEGKITSQVLKEALIDANEQINASFNKSQVTIGQKLTQIRNDIIIAFGKFDEATGFTTAIINGLENVRNAFTAGIAFIIEYKNAIGELLKIVGAIIGAYGLLGLANILRTLPALFGLVTISTRRATMGIGLMSSALISLRALLGPLNLAFIALSGAIYGGIKLYELYSRNADESSQATGLLTDKLNENIKAQKDLDKQYSDGKISVDEYTKKSKELKEQQDTLNLAVKQSEGTAYDYERALNTLANTNYAPDTSGYAKERAEIEKNIKASIELLNARKQLGIVEIKKIQSEQKATAQANKNAPLTGPGGTSQQSGLSQQLLGELTKQVAVNKEIAKKEKEMANIDEAIAKIRAGVDYKGSYGKIVPTGGGTSDKKSGGKSKTESQVDKDIKALELRAQKEIELVKKSSLSEVEKAKKILAINEQLEKDLNTLKGDSMKNDIERAKEIVKNDEEDLKKELQRRERYEKYLDDKQKARDEKIKTGRGLIQDYYEVVRDEIDKSKDKLDDFTKSIEESQKKIDDLEKALSSEKLDAGTKLAERRLEVETKIAEIRNKYGNVSSYTGISDQSLMQIGEGDLGGGLTGNIVLEAKKLYKELEVLKRNSNLISEEAQKQAEETESERIIRESLDKQKEIEKDLKTETDRLDELKTNKEKEQKIYDGINEYRSTLEKNFTSLIQAENLKRISSLEAVRQKAIATANALAKAGITNNISNTNQVEVNLQGTGYASQDAYNIGTALTQKINLSSKGINN